LIFIFRSSKFKFWEN